MNCFLVFCYFLSNFLCGVGITTFLVSVLAEYTLFSCQSVVLFFEYVGELLLFTCLISAAEGFVFVFGFFLSVPVEDEDEDKVEDEDEDEDEDELLNEAFAPSFSFFALSFLTL